LAKTACGRADVAVSGAVRLLLRLLPYKCATELCVAHEYILDTSFRSARADRVVTRCARYCSEETNRRTELK
jgi:hypothetical protein